jgi:hypothetical protein
MILIKKIHIFLEKTNNWRNQNGGQKPRWRQVDNFFNRNLTETPPSGFERYFFGANLLIINYCFQNVIWAFGI